jgi:hypothetical protein
MKANPPRPPPQTFFYGTVERALAAAHGISDDQRPGGFRSMVSNLQKLGALGLQARVGRGSVLTYTHVEFNRLILALEFCELGLPPQTAVDLLGRYWESDLRSIIEAAARPLGVEPEPPRGKDAILFLGVRLRTDTLRGGSAPAAIIEQCSLDDLPVAMKRWMETAPARGLIVNVSERVRAFHAALVPAYMDQLDAERLLAPKAAKRKAARQKANEAMTGARP